MDFEVDKFALGSVAGVTVFGMPCSSGYTWPQGLQCYMFSLMFLIYREDGLVLIELG